MRCLISLSLPSYLKTELSGPVKVAVVGKVTVKHVMSSISGSGHRVQILMLGSMPRGFCPIDEVLSLFSHMTLE